MAGVVPISFRYTNGDDFNDGNRPVRLMVNNVTAVESHDFFYTEWNYYRYSEMVYINLQEGQNTIKLVDDTGIGPYIGKFRMPAPRLLCFPQNLTKTPNYVILQTICDSASLRQL